jgi:DNA-binding XRE family transcriptional regulator
MAANSRFIFAIQPSWGVFSTRKAASIARGFLSHGILFTHCCDNSTSTMPVTSAQVRMARAALNWTVRDLAKSAGVHRNTVNNVEVGRYAGDPDTLEKIEKALATAGVQFIEENGGGPGVRLRKRQRPKKQK